MALPNEVTLDRAFLLLGKELPCPSSNTPGATTIVSSVHWEPDGYHFMLSCRYPGESIDYSVEASTGVFGDDFEACTGLTVEEACLEFSSVPDVFPSPAEHPISKHKAARLLGYSFELVGRHRDEHDGHVDTLVFYGLLSAGNGSCYLLASISIPMPIGWLRSNGYRPCRQSFCFDCALPAADSAPLGRAGVRDLTGYSVSQLIGLVREVEGPVIPDGATAPLRSAACLEDKPPVIKKASPSL